MLRFSVLILLSFHCLVSQCQVTEENSTKSDIHNVNNIVALTNLTHDEHSVTVSKVSNETVDAVGKILDENEKPKEDSSARDGRDHATGKLNADHGDNHADHGDNHADHGDNPEEYDFSYHDYDFVAGPDHVVDLSNPEFYADLTLRKCHCNGHQILTKSGDCTDHEGIYVGMFNGFQPAAASTSWFGNVEVKPLLQCPHGYQNVKFKGGNFYLLETMALYHMKSLLITLPEHFCINHLLDENGELTWNADVCVPLPMVPMCCPSDHGMDYLTGVCVQSTDSEFIPDIHLEDTKFTEVHSSIVKLNCSKDEQLKTITLSKGSSELNYTGDGTVLTWLNPPSNVPVRLDNHNFCVAPSHIKNKEVYMTSFCYKDLLKEHYEICANGTCVRKCCDRPEVFSSIDNTCGIPVQEFNLWVPTFHKVENYSLLEVERPEDLKIVSGRPICANYFVLENERRSDDKFILLSNGSVHVPAWNTSINATSYCVDNWVYPDVEKSFLHAMVCFPDSPVQRSACDIISDMIYPSLLVVSCVFLAITLAVYAAVPELHAKVHGKSLVSHVSSLLVAYISLVIVQWGASKLPMTGCVIMGHVIHISFLAAFFWLNVMCFDIYWTLRSIRPIPESGEGSLSRFKWYSVYAWGCPTIIGGVTIIMQMQDPEQHPHLILPGFGVKGCFFGSQESLWLYFYGFVLVLTIINIIFFMQVAYILIQAQRATKSILKTTTSRQDKERMKLYVKLFLVMGITWICEVISYQEGTCLVWVVSDFINALQGTLIFLIFVCKRNVYQKVRHGGTKSSYRSRQTTLRLQQLRGKCDPGISRVKRIVRTSSSYATSSQMSQRTTQITLDSLRRSSLSQQPSVVKLSNSNSMSSSMHVIHEDISVPEVPSTSPTVTENGTETSTVKESSVIGTDSNGTETSTMKESSVVGTDNNGTSQSNGGPVGSDDSVTHATVHSE